MSQTDTKTSRKRRRGGSFLIRLFLAVLATAVLAPLLLFGGVLLGLQTEAGQRLLADTIEQLASDPGRMEISIGELEGPLPHHLQLYDLSIRDTEGTWLALDRAELRWQPLKLFERRLQIDLFELGTLELDRLPPPGETAPEEDIAAPPEKIGLGVPELPLSVNLERLAAEEIRLGEAVVGTAAVLTVEGDAHAERGGSLQSRLRVERIDGTRGVVQADLLYRPKSRNLTAHVEAEEPQGGLIARALQIEGYPAVNLKLDGEGPIRAWSGHLTANAGEDTQLEARMAVVGLDPLRIDLDSTARITPLLPEDMRPLASPEMKLSLSLLRQEDGALTLRNGILKAPAARLTFNGALEGDGQTISAQAKLENLDPESFAPFMGPARFEEANARVTVGGTLSIPEITLDAGATNLSTPQASVADSQLSLQLTPDRPLSDPEAKVAFSTELQADGVEVKSPELGQTLARQARFTAAGTLTPQGRAFALDKLQGDFGRFQLTGQGGMDLERERSDLEITLSHPQLADFSTLLGDQKIAGGVRGRVTARQRPGDPLEAELQLDLSDFSSGMPLADGLLGDDIRLAGRASKPADQDQVSGKLMLVSQGLSANVEGSADLQAQTLDAEYSLDLPSLTPLENSLGTPLAGGFGLTGTLSGPFAMPMITADLSGRNLVLAGNSIASLDSALDVDLDENRPTGGFRLDAETDYGPLSVRTDFDLQDDGVLALSALSITHGEDMRITGDIGLPLDGAPAAGTLQGESIQLSRFSELAGLQLGGALDLDVRLEGQNGEQAVTLDSRLNGFRLGKPSAPDLALGQTSLQLTVQDALANPTFEGSLALSDLSAGAAEMSSVDARLSGSLEALRLGLTGQGEAGKPVRFSLESESDLTAESPAVRISSLELDYGEIPLRLQQPLSVTYGERLEVRNLDLAISDGRLSGGGSLDPETADMEFALRNLPLSLLEAINPEASLQGQASADLSLQGAPQNPQGRFELQLSGVKPQQERELGSLPELAGRITANLQDRQLRLEGGISGFAEEPLNLRGNLPVQLSLRPFGFEIAEDTPLDGKVTWSGNIENVVGLFPVDSIRLTGNGEVDITLGGTFGEPDLGGRIELSDAVYENFVSGTLLQPLNLVIQGRRDRLEITELQASDGGDGKFTGQGSIQFREGEEILSDISLEFRNMGFVHRDDVTAHLTGNLALQGDLLGRSEVSGEIRNESIEIRLVDELPPSVSELNNVIILGQDDGEEETEDEEASEEDDDTTANSGPVMALNIEINLPRRVFVRGRGLDSEWAGQFSVKGTASSPQVTGSLEPQRGSFSIAGKSFQLQEGSVSLPPGSDLDPKLDLSATSQAGDIQAIIRVRGTASEPNIELTSNPVLPEDEVLSRVLFNKNSSRLSPGEALMLANTAATLTSGGPGVTDIARNLLGADVVSFSPGEEGDEGLGSVTIGRYLAEGVYVGVEQGTRSGSTELDVELDVTDNIKVNSQTGTDGGSQIGIRWQWDY